MCEDSENPTSPNKLQITGPQATLLASVIAHLSEGVVITNDRLERPGPRIVFVNEAMCQISGYTADEMIGQSPRILQGKNTNRDTLARLKKELASGNSCQVELINYRKDGKEYHAELFVIPVFDSKGRQTNFVSIHRDISERKQIEASIRDREERLRAILNTAIDSIINIDQRGIITDANPVTELMFGYSRAELVGQNVKMLMPSPYCDEHDGYIARYLETGEARIIGIGREVVARRKDGSTFPAGLAVSQIEHLGLFTGIIRDITETKELQRQILEIAAEEDRRIGHELHDNIQQQLTGLGLLAESLAESLEENSSRQVPMAARLATGIKESARQVQLLSRGLIPVQVDAEGLRIALSELAFRVADQYGVQCDFRYEGSVSVADNTVATHLFRIVQEAVNNAIKHGRANRIEISLMRASGSIKLLVLDDGRGIGDKSETGLGMGLRIMKYRAGLIGTTLQIEPREQGGTVVSCSFRQ